MITHQDKRGNILSHVEETSSVSKTERQTSGDCSGGCGSNKCPNGTNNKSENLEEVSMPMFHDDFYMPIMSTRVGSQSMQCECLDDISAPSYVQDPRRGANSPVMQNSYYSGKYFDNLTIRSSDW